MRMFLLSFDKGSKALCLFCFKKGFNIHLAFFFFHCEHIYPLLFHNHPWILTRLTLKFKQRKEISQRKPAVGPAGLRMLSSLRPNYRVKSLHLSWHTSARASGTPPVRGNPDFPSSPVFQGCRVSRLALPQMCQTQSQARTEAPPTSTQLEKGGVF